MNVEEDAKKWNPKYWVSYVYLDESGDGRPTLDWEEETFETIEQMARWIFYSGIYKNEFKVIKIKTLNDFFEQKTLNDEINRQRQIHEEKLKKEKEENEIQEAERKRLREQEQYKLFLELKEKFENK